MQQILTSRQTGGKAIFRVSGDVYLCIEGNAYTYFNIHALDVSRFSPGTTWQTHASYIVMAICEGIL